MSSNPKQTREALAVYDIWLNSYLTGDVNTYDRHLDDDYRFIGSTGNEEFLSRTETTEFFKATADQLDGKTEVRNSTRTVQHFGELLFITQLLDFWFLNEKKWSFYGRFRLTSVMHNRENEWKFIYQHFSTPDSKADSGDTIGWDQVNKQNIELRDAIKRRTVELEHKSRELEIEAALERVRSRSLAMQKSDELKAVIKVVYEQLSNLNINLDHAGFVVDYSPQDDWHFWIADDREIPSKITHPYFESVWANQFNEAKKSGATHFVTHLNFEEKNKFYHELLSHVSGLTETSKEFYLSCPGLAATTALFDDFSLYIENFSGIPYKEEENEIVLRFGKVFQQAYTRFLDLQKAEAQAREAQIETALEKVRSRTMAMQHSDELQEASYLLDQQVRSLGIQTWGCAFNIYGEEDSTEWFGNEAGVLHTYTVPRKGIFKEYYEKGQRGESIIINEFSGKACVDHYEYMSKLPVLGDVLKILKETNDGFPTYQIDHVVYFKYGYLLFITREDVPEAHGIFKRFAKVFEQTYTRFLDLQKAEAQAREAQIEASLERVRSRSMAMQKTEELTDSGALLYQELSKLGVQNLSTGYTLFDETAMMGWSYGVNPSDGSIRHKPVGMDHTKTKVMKAIAASWKKQESLLVLQLNEQETIKHQTFIADECIDFPISKEQLLAISPKRLVVHTFNFKQGYLLIVGGELLTEAQQHMISRFAKVFQQTYTRFLDLQKAEAQAREARIEAALERTRTQSMLMQHSDEIKNISEVFHQQLLTLNIPSEFSYVWLPDESKNNHQFWASWAEETEGGLNFSSKQVTYPLDKTEPYTAACYQAWSKPERIHEEFIPPSDISDFFGTWAELLEGAQNLKSNNFKEGIYYSEAYMRYGCFGINIRRELSDGEKGVLKRFSTEFERAYTRFLDLQKAEAQAREAKIETALEKVRSRTMGMQKSDELADVADVLFKEMNNLVHNLWTCGFVLCEKGREEDEWWLGLEEGFTRGFFLPNVNDYAHAHLYEGWLKREDFRTVQLEGNKLQAHYDWLMEIPVAKNIFDEMEAAGMERPEWQKLHAAYFSKGYLVIITREPCPEEDIFKRFAQVFDLTYTRFLDLQKAEAQAREAQIENALEKVRSRSLAMQSPDELIEVAELLREEMGALGVEELETSSIYIHDDSTNLTQCWFTIKDSDDEDKSVTDQMTINLQDTWVGQEMLDFYRSGTKQTSVKMVGDRRIEWIRYCGEKSNLFTPDGFYGDSIPERTYHLYKFSNGYIGAASPGEISDESWDLLRRATSVFSFAYTRFLDLKKAKEQTREAQIELSLERIRARVTGMQESSDLLDIVVTMRTEFVNLGHEAHYFWHMRWLPDTYKKAMTSGDGTKIGMVMTLPRHIHGDIEEVAAWEKTKDPIHVLAMDVDVAVDYVDKMISLGDFERVDPQAPTLDDIRHIGGLTFVMARTTHGEIGFSLPGVVPDPPKEAVDTLVRFAGVFDLAYRRFEDLKKAEAQARENQIELALEKVRSRTMTMERSSELADTSVVVFKELLNLGIAPNRLFIGIIKDNGNAVEAWATNEDGSKIENQFQLYPSENKSIQKMVNAWKQEKKSTIIDMSGKELKDYFHYLNKVMRIPFIDGLQQKRRVQTIAYFSGGLIGMAAPEEQPQETTELLERFAAVFNLTYTRFNDLKIAEKQALQAEKDLIEIKQARQKAEDALIELKATQTQLVQQEKLASLGQLTAGIAHEIKNPLNFVNNFSEVSVELIDEALEEIEKLDHSDVKEEIVEILNDVKGNLSKVHAHGTRADSIVKSMLQHSRGGSGKMELTDLNALIKEYVNLSFHGMRAGKNPINVDIQLDLYEEIGKVNLIGEDFSRVLLNICNNAFDAMREKAKTATDYLPILSVKTERTTNDELRIAISDNGPGIPDEIKDKILQPFFTTKKGTDGTGLGLSITNDIIKAHGGEITIDSSQGKGTTFSIHLPIKGQ